MYNPYNFAVNGRVVGNKSTPDGPILRLNDGAMDWQNVPVAPLLYRGLDAIIANDNSGDTTDMWPNGTSLYMTMLWARKQGLSFPDVPSPDTVVSKNLMGKPAFYGCNATSGPLIVYIPASPAISGADGTVNIGTVTTAVPLANVPTFVNNGNALILRGSQTLAAKNVPSNWAQCVGCAVMQRQLAKLGNGTMPATCQTCFSQLCYS
jgi:lysophospholipase